MTGCFAFRFFESHSSRRANLVLFFSAEFSADVISKVVKKDIEKNLPPNAVFVIAAEVQKRVVASLLNDSSLMSEFDSFVGDPQQKLKLFFYNASGEIFDALSNQILQSSVTKSILHGGSIEIFRKRRGLIVSSPNYHFLKPSGDHCNTFIRASNLLISGDEVSFLAVSLLPFLNSNLKRIYVDTSSISYLACTAILMSGKFTTEIPVIESFESYAAFNQSFDFIEGTDSLVMISATTSGSLAARLIEETAFENQQVLTLFYSHLRPLQQGAFNISEAMPAGSGSHKPGDCTLCRRGARLIRIVGDQFLPETPTNEQLLIRKTDFSRERGEFFKEFAVREVLKWHVASEAQADSREHFFVDLEKVFASPSPEFIDLLDRKVKKHFSRDVEKVIALNDAGSKALCGKLKEQIGDAAPSITWLCLSSIDEESLRASGSVIVVAGAITSGRKLLDVSRKLRSLKKSASITYLVGFSKLPTQHDLDQLKRDLELGGHELVVLRKCPMPRITGRTMTPWDSESTKLRQWSGSDPLTDKSGLPSVLAARADQLIQGAASQDQLFLPSVAGRTLKLRPTFAFWSDFGIATTTATQADVYWTMQSILHDLRARSDDKGLGSTYHTTVINPACFDRYNDGVIQASLLRAASPLELNYSIDDAFSRKMTGLAPSKNGHEVTLKF